MSVCVRPEVNNQCLHLSLSSSFLEAASWTECGARLAGPRNPCLPCPQICCHTQLFTWVLGIQTQLLMLVWQAFHLQRHLCSQSTFYFFLGFSREKHPLCLHRRCTSKQIYLASGGGLTDKYKLRPQRRFIGRRFSKTPKIATCAKGKHHRPQACSHFILSIRTDGPNAPYLYVIPFGKRWPGQAQSKAGLSSSHTLLEDLFCFKLCVCMCPAPIYPSCMCRYLRRSEESPQFPGAGVNSSEPLDASAGNCTLNCSGFSPVSL